MAKFANSVCFLPAAGGTADFTVSSAVTGFMTPALAGMPTGVYKYRAESVNLSQWEIGEGTYTSGTGILTRTTVLYNSSGTGTASGQSGAGAKINFSAAPNVGIVQLVEDTLGVDQANSWTDAQKAQARDNTAGNFKRNRVLNPSMQISQQFATAGTSTSGGYPVDGFRITSSGAVTYTCAQVSSVTPLGALNRLRTTITGTDTSIAAGDFLILHQAIEGLRVSDLGWGAAGAKSITLSFGMKAPAGTYSVAIRNGAFDRSYVSEVVISGGEANTDVRKTITIPGDTSGTWPKDNTAGMYISWGLSVGSTYQTTAGAWQAGNYLGTSSTSNFSGTNGNVLELFDVQLVDGDFAAPYEVPVFSSELLACRRYYYTTYSVGVAIGTSTYTNSIHSLAAATGNYTVVASWGLAVPMRTTPIGTLYSPYNGVAGYVINTDTTTNLPAVISITGENQIMIYINATSVTQAHGLRSHVVLDARI